MENKRKKWPLEFKIFAVTISNLNKSVLTVAEEIGISKNRLRHWKKQYKEEKLTLHKESDSDSTPKEVIRLKKEIKNIQLDFDILDKGSTLL